MENHKYEEIVGIGFVCIDCGAFGKTEKTVEHFGCCVAGEREKWEKINDEFDWEQAEIEDALYEEYLKQDNR